MKKIVKALTPKNIYEQLAAFKILGKRYGHFKSISKKKPVDSQGNPLPWYTYPAIDFLNNLNFGDKTIFEFGSGYSTFWWSRKSKFVTSVEDNKQWFDIVSLNKSDNTKYLFSENYAESILEQKKAFDVIVIDGDTDRIQCAKNSISLINENENVSILILDNSDWYPKLTKYITDNLKWVRSDFTGFGPINAYTWTTSVWINPNRTSNLYRNEFTMSPGSVGHTNTEDTL